jgi:hypothetical protein
LDKNKKHRPDTWDDRKPAAKRNVRSKDKDKKDKTEQSNMIELSRSEFKRLVQDARRGKKRPSIRDSEDDNTDSDGDAYMEALRKSTSNNNDSDSEV